MHIFAQLICIIPAIVISITIANIIHLDSYPVGSNANAESSNGLFQLIFHVLTTRAEGGF